MLHHDLRGAFASGDIYDIVVELLFLDVYSFSTLICWAESFDVLIEIFDDGM